MDWFSREIYLFVGQATAVFLRRYRLRHRFAGLGKILHTLSDSGTNSLNHCSVRLSGFASSIQGFLLHQPPGNRVIIDTIRQVLLKTVWYLTTSLTRAAFWRRVEALVIRHFAFNGNRSGCSIVSIPTSTSTSSSGQ